MEALIVNDLHIGPSRTGGTTPRTAQALRDKLQDDVRALFLEHLDKHLVINGDSLDQFEIDTRELLKYFSSLKEWIDNSAPEAKLFNLAGNHDRSARGNKVSSFELLSHILVSYAPDKVVNHVFGGLYRLWDNNWAIPHCDNQDLFDYELEKALDEIDGPATLFLHCNYDNHFAEQADHSLNIDEETADRFVEKGIKLVIAHEHQRRVLKGGMVYITGNQFATSISDCLGNDFKYAHILEEDGSITPIQTMDVKAEFVEVDWTDLNDLDGHTFIRVTGKATAEQAADVIGMISKLRQVSQALIITNGVRIEGAGGIEDFEGISLEQIKAFDVLASLMEHLEPLQQKVVKSLLED